MLHPKRRLELIIERMALSRACNVLEKAGVTGYTVISAMAGYGGGARWSRDTDISHAQDVVVVISICDEAAITAALEDLTRLLENHIGVVSVGPVEVMRPDRF